MIFAWAALCFLFMCNCEESGEWLLIETDGKSNFGSDYGTGTGYVKILTNHRSEYYKILTKQRTDYLNDTNQSQIRI